MRPLTKQPPAIKGWVLYDGDCGFCSSWVPRWTNVLRRRGIAIAPLQSILGRRKDEHDASSSFRPTSDCSSSTAITSAAPTSIATACATSGGPSRSGPWLLSPACARSSTPPTAASRITATGSPAPATCPPSPAASASNRETKKQACGPRRRWVGCAWLGLSPRPAPMGRDDRWALCPCGALARLPRSSLRRHPQPRRSEPR